MRYNFVLLNFFILSYILIYLNSAAVRLIGSGSQIRCKYYGKQVKCAQSERTLRDAGELMRICM